MLAWASARLRSAGSASARLDAELLLGKATGWSRTDVLAHPERPPSQAQEQAFRELVGRREAAEPIAYLLGEREFYGHRFKADRRALIPRPETELLVELEVEAVRAWRERGVEPRVVDVGTGSGAVGVSLSLAARVSVVATDLSFSALSLARENANELGGEVRFVQADLLGGLRGPLHLVLANLPYVPRDRKLPEDVGRYEPSVALFGGVRGTELIERLLDEARALLASGAELAVELDEEAQAAPLAAIARVRYPSAEITVRQDAGGYDRVLDVRLAT